MSRWFALARMAVVAAVFLVAVLGHKMLNPLLGGQSPVMFLFLPVVFSMWFVGLKTGVVVLVAGGVCADYWFMGHGTFVPWDGIAHQIRIVMYFGVGTALLCVTEVMRIAADRVAMQKQALERMTEALQSRLQSCEKMADIGTHCLCTAKEIKRPVVRIVLSAMMLKRVTHRTPNIQRLDDIAREADRIRCAVEGILDMEWADIEPQPRNRHALHSSSNS